mmetsp:Transcript_4454/g.6682  ORF Transcript_4454/g.6682 Transcript_4454/m.6682 type:complete len:378 (-) Transcript_4454:23-1156(-)
MQQNEICLNDDDEGEEKKLEKTQQLSLFSSPISTLYYFVLSIIADLHTLRAQIVSHAVLSLGVIITFLLGFLLYYFPGSHQEMIQHIEKEIVLAAYWIFLGILSSVGLGSGLHTFMLYLGPLIAKVTLSATECNTLDFEKYGDNAFLCDIDEHGQLTFLEILRAVQWEAILWGLGTAIGELPPYFVARAAREARGTHEELEEVESEQGLLGKMKRWVTHNLKDLGFTTIMLMASVPNPLFDLAGLTCGHVGVPFWTFFGATVIGKAINKVHIQAVFVITMFNVHYLEKLIALVEGMIPPLEGKLHAFFEKKKAQLHRKPGDLEVDDAAQSSFGFKQVWDILLAIMIGYFLLSIIQSKAQNYYDQLEHINKKKKEKKN